MPNRSVPTQTPPSRGDSTSCPSRPIQGRDSARVLDWILMAGCALPALVLMAAIAVGNGIVFREPRKIFFRQRRMGWRGESFTLIKFRTMRDELDASGERLPDADRVTRFGKFLRNTHLDELPQLWNILCGEMSFIGPRPEMDSIHAWASERIEGFDARLAVRPGITGLAQTTQGYTGLDEEAYREKLRLDLISIQDRSLRFQTKVLIRTAVWMVRGKGWRWEEGAQSAQSAQSEAASSEASSSRKAA